MVFEQRLKISRWKSWFLQQLSLLGMPEHKSFHFDLFLFLSVFTWIRLMMNSYPYFVQITTPAQEVHFDFWCHSLVFDVAYSLWSCWQFWFKLSHVPYDDFCSICFWFLLSQKVESIFVHLFCPEHALFAPHQSCHKPVLFYAVHP